MNYRYRNAEEMKDSGVECIGKIPKEWSVNRLKNITNIFGRIGFRGYTVEDLVNEGEGAITLSPSNIENQSLVLDKKTYISWSKYEESPEIKIYNGDIVFVKTASVGKAALIEGLNEKATINPQFVVFKNIGCNKKYLYYNTISNVIQQQVNRAVNGGVVGTLTQQDINNYSLPYPTIVEQEKIAKFLDEKTAQFDSIISKKEALIEKLEEAKKSLISEVVTGKVKVVKTNDGYELVERKKEEMKDSGVEWLGDIPKKWNVKKIKYISKIYRGKFNHRPRNDPEFYDGEYPFIQTGDVANSNMYITKYTQTLNKKGYSVSKEFPKGTLIMTIAANIGDIAILDFNACFPDSIVGFTPNNNIDIKFMYYIYSIMKEEFMSTAIINTQMNLNVERIENLFIVVPNIEKQKIIVDYIESKLGNIMNTINKVRQQIQKLKEAKQSLISEAVTGKIEILD